MLRRTSKEEANNAIKENNRKAGTVEFKTLEEEIESRFADLLAAEEPALRAAESDSSERVDNPRELSNANNVVTPAYDLWLIVPSQVEV